LTNYLEPMFFFIAPIATYVYYIIIYILTFRICLEFIRYYYKKYEKMYTEKISP